MAAPCIWPLAAVSACAISRIMRLIAIAQALAKAGGLLDNRSDPRGVFVFRYEPESVARQLRPDSPLVPRGRLTPVASIG
jgi:hypothetical protein